MITARLVVDLLDRENDISHVFFSTPISRDTALATEVQRLLGFINIRTDLELCLANQRAKPKTVHVTRGR